MRGDGDHGSGAGLGHGAYVSVSIMADDIRFLLRSALFVPGDKPRAIAKAPGLGADALILDLEDAVAPEAKDEARKAAPEAIATFRKSRVRAALRVAEPTSSDLDADVETVIQAKPDIVVIAKTEAPDQLIDIRQRLDKKGWSGPLWAMIETPRAVMALPELTAIASEVKLEALVAGTNDLAEQLRLPTGPQQRDALTPHLAQIVLAARAAGLRVLDGVYNAFKDTAGFIAEARAGHAMGFDGKTLIHPAQVEPANASFAPSEREIVWAEAVIEAFSNPANLGKGAIPVNGQMVEAMHLTTARAVLAAARN